MYHLVSCGVRCACGVCRDQDSANQLKRRRKLRKDLHTEATAWCQGNTAPNQSRGDLSQPLRPTAPRVVCFCYHQATYVGLSRLTTVRQYPLFMNNSYITTQCQTPIFCTPLSSKTPTRLQPVGSLKVGRYISEFQHSLQGILALLV